MRVRTTKGMLVAALLMFVLAQCIESQAATAPAESSVSAAKVVTPTRGFLTPISGSLFLAADDPRVVRACRFNNEREYCPKFLKYGDAKGGPGPFIPPVFKAEAPNILVTFTLTDMKNVWVANDGINSAIHDEIILYFAVDSAASTVESPPGPSLIPPDPGPYTVVHDIQTSPGTTTPFNLVIWQALITDGCVSPPPVIPIDFLSLAGVKGYENNFHVMDNTSLTSTGFWNFQYTMRVIDIVSSDPDFPDKSDMTFRGKVSVVCTGLEEL